MRYLLSIYLICYAATACAQKYPDELLKNRATVNYADHYITFFVHPLKKEIFPDPNKKYHWYSANDVRWTQGGFSGKLLNGLYSDFYQNKQMKEQGRFTSGLKAGAWRSWASDGLLKEAASWKNGSLHGRMYKYDNSGKLIERASYRHGALGGKRVAYSTGDSVSVNYYRKGKVYQPKRILTSLMRKIFTKDKSKAKQPEGQK